MLDADDLAALVDARPRLEKEIRLPDDSRSGSRVYMFSIDGTLRGQREIGCLFAGEAILVQAKDFVTAFKIAKDGLADTIRLLHVEHAQRPVIESAGDGIVTDVGGRRVNGNEPGGLESDPKMRHFLGHLIGQMPWRW